MNHAVGGGGRSVRRTSPPRPISFSPVRSRAGAQKTSRCATAWPRRRPLGRRERGTDRVLATH